MVKFDLSKCDGNNLGEFNTCAELYWGDLGGPDWEDNCAGGSLVCNSSCQYDGSSCNCPCLEDYDCYLPPGFFIDCGPNYCTTEYCSEDDLPDCSCEIGDHPDSYQEGACLGSNYELEVYGRCLTTPFDPGEFDANLISLCEGFDGGDQSWPRCDYCD